MKKVMENARSGWLERLHMKTIDAGLRGNNILCGTKLLNRVVREGSLLGIGP